MSYPSLHNNTFIKALLRQPTAHTPVWLMRQAGRYLPEHRALRARAGSYLDLLRTPDYATEATLQPLRRFNLDAAVVCSDILLLPDAMGLGLYFVNGEGPRFRHPLRDEQAIANLRLPQPHALEHVYLTIAQTRRELGTQVPLIGFAGSPWTLACFMVEGGPPGDFQLIKKMLYRQPALLHSLLRTLAHAVAADLNAQIESGVQAVILVDTWGGALADGMYQHFSLFYMREVLARLHKTHNGQRIPSLIHTRGASPWLNVLADSGADALGLDWTCDLARARQLVGSRVALQGNLDPSVLLADEASIRREVRRVLKSVGPSGIGFGHVFNLGHGISPATSPEAVAVLVDAVHEFSRVAGGVHA
ncbi:uroporphyrinogen decarboxylase [Pseudomonas fontis]|uniref:Uroporphyrinogen decarboxylase n=1 Tax=Pseudomonas fontis TaxID=2942633 RepID=A0ABT5NR72_9PSED|nr:uroporphyrinogen decarboxylase [Pseudomonas fontis]MDD0977301.1 uroporphyrinogen decarboxylase [Pseudomonas fontis]MDD0990662.1 uroporphyrinogen decarboxylase [Pseudomonas fontis]